MDLYAFHATVHKVYDGDTVELILDLGFGIAFRVDLRLHGIDTPEKGQEGWVRAKFKMISILPVGRKVVVKTYKRPIKPDGSFGRWLGDVFLDEYDMLHSVSDMMLASGHAVPYVSRAQRLAAAA